jgi:putative PIG3 family NAD(P)H quinone oxidoreductase
MKAIDFTEFGAADVLQLREVPDPELRPTDLLVRTYAAGVNRADINHRTGVYGRSSFGDSVLMGLEMAGEVIAMGAEVRGFQAGDRVMGIVGGGGYAQIARIDYRMAIPVPDSMTYIEAAAVPEVFVTAHEALLHLGRLEQGESVLVQAAASGVGSAALQMARSVGARAIYGLADGAKLDRVRAFGAHRGIDRKTEDYAAVIAAETAGKGVDVIIDFVGAANLERNLRSLAPGGRLVQVGLMGGRGDANLPMDLLVTRHLQIMGTVMKSRPPEVKQAMVKRFCDRWMDRFAPGVLEPVVDSVFPLADAAAAHRRMEANLNVGKIILDTSAA